MLTLAHRNQERKQLRGVAGISMMMISSADAVSLLKLQMESSNNQIQVQNFKTFADRAKAGSAGVAPKQECKFTLREEADEEQSNSSHSSDSSEESGEESGGTREFVFEMLGNGDDGGLCGKVVCRDGNSLWKGNIFLKENLEKMEIVDNSMAGGSNNVTGGNVIDEFGQTTESIFEKMSIKNFEDGSMIGGSMSSSVNSVAPPKDRWRMTITKRRDSDKDKTPEEMVRRAKHAAKKWGKWQDTLSYEQSFSPFYQGDVQFYGTPYDTKKLKHSRRWGYLTSNGWTVEYSSCGSGQKVE
jgi:hypothetical protein